MKTLKLKNGSTALALVAHPDDETIWMGGTIMKSKQIIWTIFSLCRFRDSDREPKFRRVCEYYGVKSIMTDLDDEDKLSIDETIPVIKRLISEKIGKQKFDYIFTHGANGDYGHPRHIGVHKAVKELIKSKKLRANNAFYFNYEKVRTKKAPTMAMKKNSEYQLKLTDKEYNEKRRIVAKMYGYSFDGIDVSLSPNPEAFITN